METTDTLTKKSVFTSAINILLVEDNPADAELVMIELSDNFGNINFHRVDNDRDLKIALVEFDPHLVISDYSMPGFSGKEALSICLTLKPDVPLIFVSGTIGEERAVDALKKGAADYVLKSSLARLPHAVKTVLEKQQEKKERQQKQDELKKTYQLLNTVFEATHMMIAYLDNNFNFIQVNRSFAELHGKDRADFIGVNFFDVFAKDKYESIFRNVLASQEPYFSYTDKVELSLLKSTSTIYLDWSIAPTYSLGIEGGLVLTAVNISDRIKFEQEAIENKKRFYDALNQAPDAAIIVNAEGKIAFFNKKAESYFGHTHAEIKGQPITTIIPERFQTIINTKVQDNYVETIENIDPELLNQLHAKRKNGSEFPIDITVGTVTWNHRKAVISMIRDITDKKKKEVELKKLSMVASKINNAVFIGDHNFNPIWVNKAFLEQTGYKVKDIKDSAHEIIFSDSKSEDNAFEDIMSKLKVGEHVYTETELTKKNGTKYWASIHASPVEDKEGNLQQIIAIISNITHRKMAEIERDKVLRTLEERVAERTAELQEVLEQLQEKNKDIEDSIKYARNIQEAFIPKLSSDHINSSDTFVLNRPKDILSGDFHWHYTSKSKNCSYIALGDCTGHGVPGSLMTILSVQLLEQRIIGKAHKRSPSKILKEIDTSIIRFLGQEGQNKINDGLEIILMRIDHDDQKITFSGAGRPLYHMAKGAMNKHRFSRFSVGGSISGLEKTFEDITLSFQKGDRVYSFSDGYPDQFGGPDNKKFSRKRLEKLLEDMQTQPFDEHYNILQNTLDEWQGNTSQIDDVIVMGIEL